MVGCGAPSSGASSESESLSAGGGGARAARFFVRVVRADMRGACLPTSVSLVTSASFAGSLAHWATDIWDGERMDMVGGGKRRRLVATRRAADRLGLVPAFSKICTIVVRGMELKSSTEIEICTYFQEY